ncbi:MAG: PIN domain-containing protein [Candidatus Entotheonellia bacterium]
MGASYAIVSQLPSERFQIALTVPLYLQYQDVLTRPEHMTGASTPDDIHNFLRYLCSIAHRQHVFFLWRPWLKDPTDDMVLEAAVASQSRYIITQLRTISAILPRAGLRRISGLCLYAPASFYTASGVESYEYDHGPITEVFACQN